MMERYNGYLFLIDKHEDGAWFYEIYDSQYPELPAMRISSDFYETEQEAAFAAIGHISLLEEGEG